MKKIRNVKSRDLKTLLKLEKQVFGSDAFSKEQLQEFLFNHEFFLKMCKGRFKNKIIGFIITIKDRKDRMNIVNFLVATRYQMKGNGTLLLDKAINLIKDLKEIKKIILCVKIENQKAINLYKRFSFHIVRKIERYYSSGDDAYLMEKILY